MNVAPSSGESRGEVDVVADQHRGARASRCGLMPPAPLVSTIVFAPVGRGGAHAVHDAAGAVPLVVVGAGADDEHVLAARA